ncbi:MAG: multidrug efflux SMR transporter [Methylacidiphilales bacterium]|nr:multidrug efflux SMR transporter [Candidatus Methylacidiphilales bacterium]MDW8349408.1 multidrug efflux SMR transporter [Verrucomicrobiae bacterium]
MLEGVSPWWWVVAAGLCEVVYAVVMPQTQGFTRLWPSLFTLAFIAASMYCLSLAMRGLPVGTAYAVWVGIGACGTALVGVCFLGESRDVGRLLGIGLIVVGIVLVKLSHR